MLIYNKIVVGYKVDWDNIQGFFSDYCGWVCWSEMSLSEKEKPKHCRLIGEFYGIAVWYDFGADYFFFQELTA